MALTLPRSLSPSKLSAFKDCPLAFRFAAIDRLPEAPAPHMVKGTLVHSALERFSGTIPGASAAPRRPATRLDLAWQALQDEPELASAWT